MADRQHYFEKTESRWLILSALILSIPAFIFNLDVVPFIGDEGIRSLVALEMKWSGNFIVPTMNGEYYFNKPPLYNWILLLTSELFGDYGEWPSRLTTLFFLAIYAWTVFHFMRKSFDRLTAVSMALMLITSGRILFWDSMLGLIDICFSWLIFLNFMLWYYLPKKEKWSQLFLTSYILIAAAFLLKGLPAVVFQGITVIGALWYHGAFRKKIFSAGHIGGGVLFILICGSYYAAYARYVDPEIVFSVLLEQSLKRTGTHHTIWETLLHLFTFPFEQFYHFLPWSVLIIGVFHPAFIRIIRTNDFVRYSFIILVANLVVYWTSVEVYPRYLLMFVPLFNLVLYYVLIQDNPFSKKILRIFYLALLTIALLVTVVFIIFPLVERSRQLSYWPIVWIIGSVTSGFITYGLYRDKRRMLIWAALSMLVLRIAMSALVLPFRAEDLMTYNTRNDAVRLASKYKDRDWYLYSDTYLHEVARFYTSKYKGNIIRRTKDDNMQNVYYLVNKQWYPDFSGEVLDSIRLETGDYIMIMQKDSNQ